MGILSTGSNRDHPWLKSYPYFVNAQPTLNSQDDLLMLAGKIIEYIKKGQAILFQYQKNGNVELLRNLCKTQRMQAWYGLEWAIRRILKPIAIAMGEKSNEIDRPSPCHECG